VKLFVFIKVIRFRNDADRKLRPNAAPAGYLLRFWQRLKTLSINLTGTKFPFGKFCSQGKKTVPEWRIYGELTAGLAYQSMAPVDGPGR
jgi:hypothetical protein